MAITLPPATSTDGDGTKTRRETTVRHRRLPGTRVPGLEDVAYARALAHTDTYRTWLWLCHLPLCARLHRLSAAARSCRADAVASFCFVACASTGATITPTCISVPHRARVSRAFPTPTIPPR